MVNIKRNLFLVFFVFLFIAFTLPQPISSQYLASKSSIKKIVEIEKLFNKLQYSLDKFFVSDLIQFTDKDEPLEKLFQQIDALIEVTVALFGEIQNPEFQKMRKKWFELNNRQLSAVKHDLSSKVTAIHGNMELICRSMRKNNVNGKEQYHQIKYLIEKMYLLISEKWRVLQVEDQNELDLFEIIIFKKKALLYQSWKNASDTLLIVNKIIKNKNFLEYREKEKFFLLGIQKETANMVALLDFFFNRKKFDLSEWELNSTLAKLINKKYPNRIIFQGNGKMMVRANLLGVEQVLVNIINNAFKHAKSDQVKIRVSKNHQFANVEVINEQKLGVKVFPAEVLSYVKVSSLLREAEIQSIFVLPYTTSRIEENEDRWSHGHGLKLAWRYLKAMGGRIDIRSNIDDRQTVVRIQIPLSDVPVDLNSFKEIKELNFDKSNFLVGSCL